MNVNYTIQRLQKASNQNVDDINNLSQQLLPGNPRLEIQDLEKVVSYPSNYLFFAVNEKGPIIGMILLVVLLTLEQRIGFVENLVVDESVRKKGVASALMDKVHELAKTLQLHTLHLTSRPSRIAANEFYKKRGFKIHETNYYKLELLSY